MANKLKGEVSFEANDETYTLLFSIDALCQLEDKLDLGIAEIAKRLERSQRLSFLRTVLWAGLQEHHPGVDEKAAGELIREVGIGQIALLFAEAFAAAFPTAEAKAGGEAPLPEAAAAA